MCVCMYVYNLLRYTYDVCIYIRMYVCVCVYMYTPDARTQVLLQVREVGGNACMYIMYEQFAVCMSVCLYVCR